MRNLWFFDFTYWLTWVSLAIGIGVGWMVFIASGYLGRRRRLAAVPDEEDLPWDDLLEMLKARQDGEGGSLPEGWDDLSSEELLQLLLVKVPETPTGDKAPAAPENASALPAGRERRNSRRRWSNPTEVRITAPFHEKPLHGLVINRSTGGLAFLADAEFPAGTESPVPSGSSIYS